MAEEPPYLAVGTEVSAKYKGAFCEAKIRKVVRSVKCKVTFKLPGIGSITIPDDQVKGQIRNGATVEVKHPDRKDVLEATITKVQDCSQYTVVFDDGDITTLRRTALCLKSGRHFAESETLDQLPLTHPEHFSNPVIGGRRGRRRGGIGEASEDEEAFLNLKDYVDIKEEDIGRVVCVEGAEKKKQKDNWFPALVVAPTAQDQSPIDIRLEYLVRSFKDGRYYTVPKKEAQQFTREIGSKVETTVLKTAVEKALLFLDKDELPPHWDRDSLFGQNEFPGTDSEAGLDYESSDDEPREEKDHFVAQLYKFMDDSGTPINKGPIICNQDVDLYKLFKVVQNLGGFNRVSNHNNWKLVSNKMGFGQNPATVNLVKQSYKKFLYSFEEFYRKLGCTMVNHPRTSRTRTRSTRSLIRDRDKAVKVEPKPETKEKKRRSSTASITIKVEPSESNQEHKTTSPVSSKEKSLTKLVVEKCTEEIKIKEEPPELDVIDVHDQNQANDLGDSPTKPQSNLFAKSESHSELNGVYTINPGFFIPAIGVTLRWSPILKNEILGIKKSKNSVVSKSALKINKKQAGVTRARRMITSASGIYAIARKGRRRSNKKSAKKNLGGMPTEGIKIKQEPLDVSYNQIDIKKLLKRKPRNTMGRSESVKEIKSVPHRNLETIVPPITNIPKKITQTSSVTQIKTTKERVRAYVSQNETKTEMSTSSPGTHEIVEKEGDYGSTGTSMPFPVPINIKVEPPDGYEQWYGGPSVTTKEKTATKKVPDVPPVEEIKIKQEPPDETDVTVEPKETKKTRQRKTSDSIVGKSELHVLPTRNRRIFTDTVTTRPKKDKPKPLAVKKEKSPVAPRLKRQTIKDQFKMKTTKAANPSLGSHDNAEKASKGKGKEDASTRVKKDDTGHAVSSDEKRKGRKRRERNEFFDMGFEPLPCYKTINVGDKLKVYYGPKHDLKVTYEAKVLSIRQEGSDTMYLVHYYGWNTRYDEWIKHSRIADNMSSGRITKKSLQASHINGRRRTTQTRTPVRVDPDIIVIPDDPKSDNLQVTPPATIKPKGTRSSTRTANKRLMSISENEDNEADHLPHETSSRKKLILDTHEVTESTPSDRRGRKRKSVESEEKEKSEDEHDLSKGKQKKRSIKKLDIQSKESTQETITQENLQANAPKEPKQEISEKKNTPECKQEPIQEKSSVVKKDEEIKTIPIKVEPPSPTMPDESPINFEGFDQSSDEEFSLYLDEEALDNCSTENKKESSKENSGEIVNEKVEAPLPKGCDYDLNEIRSQLKGIETTTASSGPEIKVEPEEEPEEITVEEVQDDPSEAEEEEDEEEVEEDARESDDNVEPSQSQSNSEISAPVKQEVEDIYEFKEPEPFEFESRKIDEKNKLQRRSLNRYIEENKLSPQRKKDMTLSPTYSSTRFTLPEDNLISVQKDKDIPVSEYSTFQTCEEAFDKICASPLRAANEAVPLFEEQVVNDHIEDNLDDDSQDRLVISERYSDNDNDTNEAEQKEEIYTEETMTEKDVSTDNISKTVTESEKSKEEIRDEWKDEVEDEELSVAIQRVINRDSSDESNDSVILTNQSSIRGETTKIENNFDLAGKPNFNYQFGFSIKHSIDPEPKQVICEKSNEVETDEVDDSLADDNSVALQKVESHEEENKDDEPSDKEEVCEVTTEEVKSDDEETQNEITEENIIIDSEEIDVTGEIVDNAEIDEETTTEVLVAEPIEATELVETEVEETEIDETTQIVEATVETIEVEETEEIAEATEIAELVTVTEEVAGTEEIVDTEEVEVMNDVDDEEEEDEDMEEVENEQVYDISYSEEKPALVDTEIAKIENISTVKVEEDEYEVVEGIERDEEDEDVVVEVKDVLLKEDDIEDKDEDAEEKIGVIDDKDEDEEEEDEEEENLISLLCDEEIIPNSPNHQPVEIQEEEIKTSLPETKSFDGQDADNDEEIPLIEKIKETSKEKETPAETSSLPGSPNSTKTSRKKEKQPSTSISRNSAKKDSNSKKKNSSDDSKKHRSETRLKKSEGKTCTKKGRRPRKKSQDTVGKRKYSRSTRHHGSDSDDTYENPRAGSSKESCHRPSRNSKYNFLVKFEPEHDSNQRISLIQQSMQQLRIAYSDLKAELAVVDRRRKKIRRRERENAANRSHQYK